MKRILTLGLVLIAFSCRQERDKSGAESTAKLDVQLICEDIGSTEDAPAYAVYAIINSAKAKLMEVGVDCETIASETYEDYEIPQDALTAIGGWWAGGGDYFYALKTDSGNVTIYHAAVDEGMETPGYPYRPIATYEKGKFSVSLPVQ